MAVDETQDYNPQDELDSAISDSQEEETDIERLIRERFGDDNAEHEEVSGPSDVSSPTGEESVPAADSSPTPEPDLEVWEYDDGLKLDKETARSLAEFNQFLADNPAIAQTLKDTIAQQYVQQQAPTPPPVVEPPEELDLSDPTVKALWDNYQAQQQQLQQTLDAVQRHEMLLTTQTEASAQSFVDRAVVSFQKDKGLTDEQMGKVRDIAGNMNIVESVFSATDPVTGLPRKVDPLTAIERALDIAYWSIPEYREQEIDRKLSLNREDRQKKAKLSSLGGSSGSVPREQPAPTTKEELQKAMINEVAQHMGVSPSS